MPVKIIRLGTPRHPDEGVRFGTVRRPPRGVRKDEYAKLNFYDVWLPNLSPSEELLRKKLVRQPESETRQVGTKLKASVELSQAHGAVGEVPQAAGWKAFEQRFRAELKQPDKAHLLDALAALSHQTNFSVGCYCKDEKLCHRSILRDELKKRGAHITSSET